MEHMLVANGYIPLNKSWIIRVGVLDLLNGYDDTENFLGSKERLSDDLQYLYHALIDWKTGNKVRVGESATLYRFLKFTSWNLGLKKEFILEGTLKKRKICNDMEIVHYSQRELLELDHGTSQWASAAAICGDEERIPDAPYKLKLTYEAIEHWRERRIRRLCWEPRYDETILGQAVAYLDMTKYGKTSFVPSHSEDYCFARTFGLVGRKEGERLFPSIKGHETNRIKEMDRALEQYENGKEIDSNDHRVVQAIVMKGRLERKNVKIKYMNAVNKSWPEFWKFLNDSTALAKATE